MKGIKFAIEWIAMNDEPAETSDAEAIAGLVTVALVADLFGKSPEEIARRVLRYRNKIEAENYAGPWFDPEFES